MPLGLAHGSMSFSNNNGYNKKTSPMRKDCAG